MDFSLSKTKQASQMPEGSKALTANQLGLLRFRKEEVNITDEEYLVIVVTLGGVDIDNKIPFAKVGDVLGGLDRLGEFKKRSNK